MISLKTATNGLILEEGYVYDAIGNVKQRSQYWDAGGFHEGADYDVLNRLERSVVLGQAAQVFTYDDVGNIKSKTGVGSGNYVYPAQGAGSVRPNAVSSIPGVGSFAYDANGNLTSGAGRTVSWTSYDMPERISGPVSSSTFVYGPEHQRVRQERSDGTVVIYAGAQEVEKQGTTVRIKTYWPMGLGMESERAGVTELNWVHVDRLGSPIGYTDQAGNLTDRLGYAAWGKRRTPSGTFENGTDTPDSIDGRIDNRGFTGHEMLEKLELVHMNGRVFDPLLGRFMSADPLIEDPMNGQSYNRYSYVLNNPTNLVDPTGFSSANPADPNELVDGKKVVITGSKIPGVETGASLVQIAEPAREKKSDARGGGNSANNRGSSINSDPLRGAVQTFQEYGPNHAGTNLRHIKSPDYAEAEVGTMIGIAASGIPFERAAVWGYDAYKAFRIARGRKQYVAAVTELKDAVTALRAAGGETEQIARAVSAERRAIGEQFKNLTPKEKLAEIHERNLREYQDKLGPSVDWLRAKGKTWDQIIESATRTGGKDLGL